MTHAGQRQVAPTANLRVANTRHASILCELSHPGGPNLLIQFGASEGEAFKGRSASLICLGVLNKTARTPNCYPGPRPTVRSLEFKMLVPLVGPCGLEPQTSTLSSGGRHYSG